MRATILAGAGVAALFCISAIAGPRFLGHVPVVTAQSTAECPTGWTKSEASGDYKTGEARWVCTIRVDCPKGHFDPSIEGPTATDAPGAALAGRSSGKVIKYTCHYYTLY